jgi:hypothetical protein
MIEMLEMQLLEASQKEFDRMCFPEGSAHTISHGKHRPELLSAIVPLLRRGNMQMNRSGPATGAMRMLSYCLKP